MDIANDFNIPAFAVISSTIHCQPQNIIFGFGAHFDPKIAVSRSLTELNQLLFSTGAVNADRTTTHPRGSDWQNLTIPNI